MDNRLPLALALAPVLLLKDRLRLFVAVGCLDVKGVISDARRPGLISVISGEYLLSTSPSASATSSTGLGNRLGLSLVGSCVWYFEIYEVSHLFFAYEIQ